MEKVGIRNWLALIVVGLVGQLAWAIENMFLNLFVFEQTQTADFVPWMVALSAAAATITTLLIGALSDKIGKRKAFISFGYIAWGLSIGLFSFITKDNVAKLFPSANAIFLTGTFTIILDCIMTFFGSSANDAAFNAFATDVSTPQTSGKIEAVLSILPLIAMLMIFGGFSGMAKGEGWTTFFLIFGILTTVIGVLALFLFPKDKVVPKKDTKYFKQIFHGFRPNVVKENPLFYLTLLAFMFFGISMQTFIPYFLIQIQYGLGFADFDFTIIMAVVLILASVLTVLTGVFLLKTHVNIKLLIVIGITIGGLIGMFFAKEMVTVIIVGTVFMTGNMVGTTILGSKVRDYTPRSEVGLFQGIRMIFVVLLPMIIGPFIGQAFYGGTSERYLNEYNEWAQLPNEYIYLAGAIVLLITVLPLLMLFTKEKTAIIPGIEVTNE